jgi:hypothetical protein
MRTKIDSYDLAKDALMKKLAESYKLVSEDWSGAREARMELFLDKLDTMVLADVKLAKLGQLSGAAERVLARRAAINGEDQMRNVLTLLEANEQNLRTARAGKEL